MSEWKNFELSALGNILLSISSTNYYWLKIVWIHHHLLKKYCRANLKNAKNKNVFLARKITHLELQRNEAKMVKKSWLFFCQLNIYVSILQRSVENHRTAEIRVEIKNIISRMLQNWIFAKPQKVALSFLFTNTN